MPPGIDWRLRASMVEINLHALPNNTTRSSRDTMRPWFQYGAAPMVNQSDVAFRLTAVQYGATATWTYVARLMQTNVYSAGFGR